MMARSSLFLGAEHSWIAVLGMLLQGRYSKAHGSRSCRVAFHPYHALLLG